ncbi:hypothetical protein SARC_11275 [Sphaeroforma arctica JP610]|uniref:F-box domain-containing protein n=1 Tax=Sphaeroforma arctica JP610 TaxID=667725 RepID=A0A0L0FHI8_9EUKA|nr:hypothetical protein SARC_11275 [Sphaeroforma arctica JP610]KNC76215.1 hypothetical protein SARC_11275 [Sphaeroforma arctica JP610]|eukprot:XP_014150117.1 hypothetical protein SARC_11275 [Sphaeroforma arctica JP610]
MESKLPSSCVILDKSTKSPVLPGWISSIKDRKYVLKLRNNRDYKISARSPRRSHTTGDVDHKNQALLIEALPNEIVLKICAELRFHTLVECKSVSRAFYTAACDPSLYTKLPYKIWDEALKRLSFPEAIDIARSYPQLETWNFISGHEITESSLASLARAVPNLKRIDITEVDSGQDLQLPKYWPRLEKLVALELPAYDLSCLVELELLGGHKILPAIASKSLLKLSAGRTSCVQDLLDNCPNMRNLKLHWQSIEEKLSSPTLKQLAVFCVQARDALHGCTTLQELEVTQVSSTMFSRSAKLLRIWTGNAPCFLLDSFPEVTTLECNGRFSTIDEGFASCQLQKLEIAGSLPNSYGLPNVTNLVQNKTSLRCTRLSALKKLHMTKFVDKQALIDTLLQCPDLHTIHLQCAVPWSDGTDGHGTSVNRVWTDFLESGFGDMVRVTVGDELRGAMPPSFEKLLREHKVGYLTSSDCSMYA